jgi:hypothetical protein
MAMVFLQLGGMGGLYGIRSMDHDMAAGAKITFLTLIAGNTFRVQKRRENIRKDSDNKNKWGRTK